MKGELLIVGGPTASGKTRLAIDLALRLETEIISFDSRQFYKEMRIGTARPTDAELQQVNHHFIGHISVTEEYSAGRFAQDALTLLEHLFQKHRTVVLVGGSGLYLDALLYGFDPLPPAGAALRKELQDVFEAKGLSFLQQELLRLDPEYAAEVDMQNPHRLLRALEVIHTTGRKYSEQRRGNAAQRPFTWRMVGIDWPRAQLYERINRRVEMMMEAGLLEEVKSLQPLAGYTALQTVGYRELFDHLEGKTSLEQAIALIQQNTRRYAKRQLTWFRKYQDMEWYTPGAIADIRV